MNKVRWMSLALVPLFLAALGIEAEAQFTFSNFLETRLGKDPNDPFPNVPDNRLTRFDQFSLDYFRDNLQLGFRFESYVPSDNPTLEFSKFTHRYADWNSNWVEARVGNYEALFGRGVVLRAFELTGIVREEVGTPQFGDSRDLDGVRVQFHGPRYAAVILNGKPRRADDPPTRSRNGVVTGGELTLYLARGLQVGGEYLRLDSQSPNPGSTVEVPGAFAALNLDPWLKRVGIGAISAGSYGEFARASGLGLPPASSSPKVDPDEGRALYLAQNISVSNAFPGVRVGASWEYKDYQNFELGVNEPPSLVREHLYALPNRTTHVLQANQEEGYQFETWLHFGDRADLTLNWSRAENRGSQRFKEFYAELTGRFSRTKWSVFGRTFQDPTESLFDSETIGTSAVLSGPGPHSFDVQYEQMTGFRRAGAIDIPFKDNYASLTYSFAGYFSLAATRQTTDDPREAEDPVTGERSRLFFDALSASVRLGNHHEMFLFWGNRRSGLQCTAGTCYLVRAFDGVILQLASRF